MSERTLETSRDAALRGQDDLRRRIDEFETLLRVLPVGVFIARDPDCDHISMNPAGAAMLGLGPDQNASKSGPGADVLPFRVFRNGVELEPGELAMQRAARTGVPVINFETEVMRADGSTCNLYEYAVPLFDEAGAVRGCLGLFVDITERKRAETALKESERRYRELAAMLPVGVCLCEAPDGRITYYNRQAALLWGREPQPGARDERLCGSLRLYHPDGTAVAPGDDPVATVLAGGAPVRNAELIVERPDRSRLHIMVSVAPIRDDKGVVVGALEVFQDVSELRRRDQVRAFHAAIVESSDDAIISKGLDGTIYSWNLGAERIFGFRAAEMIGQPITRIVPPELHQDEEDLLARLRGGMRIKHYETIRLARDGRRIEMSITISPVRNDAGRIIAFSSIGRDVTTERRARRQLRQRELAFLEELRRADRRKDEFLATLAHELRNPLAPIANGLEVLRATGGRGETAERTHRAMVRQVEHLRCMVDDLLDVSRVTRGMISLRRERVGLAELVESAIETSRPLIEAANHTLTFEPPGSALAVDADPVRIAQVLANLLNNAARYTPAGGSIRLRAWREGGAAVITVSDTGIGIEKEMLTRVFEMFSQGERSPGAREGLGIGLTLARTLVEMHGGSIMVASDGPGRGSEFTIRLPAATDAGGDGAGAPEPQATRAVAARRRVLVIDDHRDAAETLGALLQLMGHEVQVVHDGRSGVEAALSARPDVILLDIGLPDIDGYEVARRLRGAEPGIDSLLVAMTGYGQESDRRLARAAGFDRHIVKPVGADLLERLLAETDMQCAD